MSDSKKILYEDYSSLTDDSELSYLDALTKEDISKKLMAAIDFIKTQHERISKLESDLLDVKLAFADAMTLRFVDLRSSLTSQPSVPVHSSKPLYSQAVRGQQAPVLVASFSSSAMPPDRISLAGLEKLLDSGAGGPFPASVRQKDNNIFVRLNDPANLDRAKSILESKAGPDSVNIFNSESRPTKLYLPSLKDELMLRNFGLKGKIDSESQFFAKPNSSNKGHVKILFNCKEARDLAILNGETERFADVLNVKDMAMFWRYAVILSPAVVNALVHILLETALARCLQVNLRYSKVASASLAEVIVENKFDVILIQEPYAKNMTQFSGIGGILTKLSIVAVDSNALNKIWNSKCTNARGTELESVISDNCLQIFNQHLDQLSFVPDGTSFLDLTLAGSSVKSSRWFFPSIPSMSYHPYIYFEIDQRSTSSSPFNSVRTEVRTPHISRINVEQFRGNAIFGNDSISLEINFPPLDQISFVPDGTSFLDLTLAGSSVKSSRWFFPSIPSMSYHPYIYFEIDQRSTSSSPFNSVRTEVRTSHISRINVEQFRGKFSAAIKLLSVQSSETTQSIDLSIVELCALISSAACSSRTNKLFEPGARNMPWWSKELCSLRHKTRQAFQLWSAQRTEVNKNTFKVLKTSYQREVRKAKQCAWKLLCNYNPGSSDLFSALNAASGKLSCIGLPTVICIDGIEVSEPLAILEKCAQHFFPEPPTSKRDAHLPAEKLAESYSFSSHSPSFIFPPITPEELASAVTSMNVKSSPGL
ncbi:hypothetical protein DAPPUDRAFT_113390 [Daphnia pulex]|uniref:Endonuclease/exonuclease/phosphatase domain-containing protein n=1 Tax=Daphnia pulex TaxID=6669 RepID=E9HEW5_DAPPU|nr:hypothetical protein DAPPUDRAFT_113390 [Daphnia pulex]|eukprot:EFX69741.1 hypothetical protein DAPPUDRAFT_113390 [Daphnia pulex]